MAIFCCDNRPDCVGLAAAVSVILGIIAAFLRITAVISVTPAFLWVTLGVAIGFLAVLLGFAGCCLRVTACNCGNALTAVLAGILGTAVLSVVLLAISFAATSIVGAILVGLLVLFFFLILFGAACLIRCLANTQN